MKRHGNLSAVMVGVLIACALFLHPVASRAAMSSCGPGPIDFNTVGGIGDTGWVINLNDFLVVTGASSQVNERLNINLRFVAEDIVFFDQISLPLLAGDRSVQQIKYDFTPVFAAVFANRSYAKQVFLSDISIEAVVATTRGQTFARVNLYRFGTSLNQNVKPIAKCAIMSDYVTTQVTACLRNARHFTSIEGQGVNNLVSIANPGANTDWNTLVPTNARWKLKTIQAVLSADANVGNRIYVLQINKAASGLAIWAARPASFVTASQNIVLQAAPGIGTVINSAGTPTFDQYIPLPAELILGPGDKISSFTAFIGAADAWTGIVISFEEWLDNV